MGENVEALFPRNAPNAADARRARDAGPFEVADVSCRPPPRRLMAVADMEGGKL
jgi:hypothetical protein